MVDTLNWQVGDIKLVVQFLLQDPTIRDRALAAHGIHNLKFDRRKLKPRVAASLRASRLRRANLAVHSDFQALMDAFEIDLHTGRVDIRGTARRPAKDKRTGYLNYNFMGRTYPCHRLVMMKATGKFLPPGCEVHHVNMVKTDNRVTNLEIVTPAENKAAWMAVKTGKVA